MAFYTDSTVFEKSGPMTDALHGEILGWAHWVGSDRDKVWVLGDLFPSVEAAMRRTDGLSGEYLVALQYCVEWDATEVLKLKAELDKVVSARAALATARAPWMYKSGIRVCPSCGFVHKGADLLLRNQWKCSRCSEPLCSRTAWNRLIAYDKRISALSQKLSLAEATKVPAKTAWYVECGYIKD